MKKTNRKSKISIVDQKYLDSLFQRLFSSLKLLFHVGYIFFGFDELRSFSIEFTFLKKLIPISLAI